MTFALNINHITDFFPDTSLYIIYMEEQVCISMKIRLLDGNVQ